MKHGCDEEFCFLPEIYKTNFMCIYCQNCADDEKRRLLKEHEDENRRQKDASKIT